MKILIIGKEKSHQEFVSKFGDNHDITRFSAREAQSVSPDGFDLIFDYLMDQDKPDFSRYPKTSATVFFNTVHVTLNEILTDIANFSYATSVFGFNGFPTFVNRPFFEVTLGSSGNEVRLKEICNKLGTEYLVVKDQLGMVSPRIISMIVNEAYFTLQEGTATASDIDLALKLGTNYPFGPIEWSKKIGVKNIYDLLIKLHKETNDERYRPCSLLATMQ